MAVDLLKILAILAGFLMIGAATVLALRQTVTWQHVVIFCLGGVLAGISGVQLQAGKDNWSVNIGQLADAASKTSEAASQQADALAALSNRVDQLQAAIAALQKMEGAQPQHAELDRLLAMSSAQKLAINRALNQSRALSLSAATTSRLILAGRLQPAMQP